MPSGGLSRAADNRSLADDLRTARKMELSEGGGRMGAMQPIHLVSARDISLSRFYLCRPTDMIQKYSSPLNKSPADSYKQTNPETQKLNVPAP